MIDYARQDNWLIADTSESNPFDIFVISQTTYFNPLFKYSSIKSFMMRNGMHKFYDQQLKDFSKVGNLFMPFYRQSSFTVLFKNTQTRLQRLKKIPLADVKQALDYYLENFNHGRPFIILGHSQGGQIANELIFDKDNNLPNNLVAIYSIGNSVIAKDFEQNLKYQFSKKFDDVHSVVSFNVIGGSADVNKLITYKKNSLAINPISWSVNSEELATNNIDLAPAQLDLQNGVVRIPDEYLVKLKKYILPTFFPLNKLFPYPAYHQYEILLYKNSIAKNMQDRIKNYNELKEQK